MKRISIDSLIPKKYIEVVDAYFKDKYTYYVLKGGRGGLKSSIAITLGVLNVLRGKGNTIVIRRYKNTLRGSVYAEVQKAINRLGVSEKFISKVSPLEYVCKSNGLKITFAGLDDSTKLKSSTVAEGNYTTVIYEECQEMVKSEVDNTNITFVRSEEHCNLIYCYNPPPSALSWVNKELGVIGEDDDDKIVLDVNYIDVPKKWLGKQFLKMAERMKKNNYDGYLNVYLGQAVGGQGAVFKNIRQLKDKLEYDSIRRGLDFGFALDNNAYVEVSYDAKTNSLYIIDEFVGKSATLKTLAYEIKKRNKFNFNVFADCAEPRSIHTLNTDFNLSVTPTTKGQDSVRHGIQWLQGLDNIYIYIDKCPISYKEFIEYEYKRNKMGEYISEFVDKDNHCIDAVRYSLNDVILY